MYNTGYNRQPAASGCSQGWAISDVPRCRAGTTPAHGVGHAVQRPDERPAGDRPVSATHALHRSAEGGCLRDSPHPDWKTHAYTLSGSLLLTDDTQAHRVLPSRFRFRVARSLPSAAPYWCPTQASTQRRELHGRWPARAVPSHRELSHSPY